MSEKEFECNVCEDNGYVIEYDPDNGGIFGVSLCTNPACPSNQYQAGTNVNEPEIPPKEKED